MKRIAVYPGSFDPPTMGHVDIIERGAALFDELIVAVAVNSQKQPFFTTEERVEILKECCADYPNARVDSFQGLLVDYAQSQGASAIVRGLRALSDFEYEFQMASINRKLNEQIDTVCLLTRWEHAYLSSSIVKELFINGGDATGLAPEATLKKLAKRRAAG
ncbi:MAG: pantetheine-phosphate adenylyltransferase [Armatimonadetes bacterium]|nr:pantetheine-phosphate adenylyltransferase [Armatimonadota bacterium]